MAKPWIMLVVALGIVVPGCGGGTTPSTDSVADLTALLGTIKDDATAKAALPKIAPLVAKIKASVPKPVDAKATAEQKTAAEKVSKDREAKIKALSDAAGKLEEQAKKNADLKAALDTLKDLK